MRARVRARLAAERFDVALVYGSGVAQYVEDYPDLPRVIQFSDLDSLKWEQYAAASRPPKRWVYQTESRRLLAYERGLAATFTRSLVCSDRECDEFHRRIPDVPVDVVRNGVDLDRFRPAAGGREPHHLLFTGVMNYLPNVDGVTWFCRDIFPRIRTDVPLAQVHDLWLVPDAGGEGARPSARCDRHRRRSRGRSRSWLRRASP